MTAFHPDDEFHPPTDDNPYWTETCWFTFTVPERRMSGQLYPFFRTNQRVAAGGAYFWDDRGSEPWNCLWAKNFWHLPIPDQPLSDIRLPNGIHYQCLEAQHRYRIRFDDPDADEIHVDLEFTSVAAPHYLGAHHLDQPGRYTGTIQLRGETVPVDSYGFRDRSWGPRSQFGVGLSSSAARNGGYSYATASANDAFHTITMDFGNGCNSIHGYLIRDGEWAKLAFARREVVERDPATGYQRRVRIEGVDTLGRELVAEGRCLNQLAFPINPNLFTINCLTEWTFGDVTAYGEDHDNWSQAAIRQFTRGFLGYEA